MKCPTQIPSNAENNESWEATGTQKNRKEFRFAR